ncbi:hypothetical protein A3C17_00280 [Candidatus Uhrbacteria bacterium RIFCSPHIGHO2_02_FULL_53_13]|uniref:Glycosyl transferase family 1 domain-containing protein n=2 Tax=Candidatus Uhriibacteriota TaxID=1752732 RepID=A0A1F7U1S5_9BACT|nr:MAG: hypothetical protein A3C17_00280 [Candidatus Uhrbacteria bacterium RIFCSPHIGHO2_02_FULL_53_13]OGL90142.1 MAG: hypothetical protein A3I45_00380 [Candidatus Uhrbacteria bacterium RIFCSPLOWO2_02_FULL_53_10]
MSREQPNIALVHDHLIQDGGAERVLRVLSSMYPDAPIFTLLHDPKQFSDLANREIKTSFLQRIPGSLRHYQWLLPLMPTATEHYDLRDFDIVISSTSAFSKGVIVHPKAHHICYCHTPTRYLWTDTQEYVRELKAPGIVKRILPHYLSYLRQWDRLAAERVDTFIANSQTVKDRIRKYYQKDAHILYPPVDTEQFHVSNEPKTYFVAGGRIVAYKRFDLVVEAANRLRVPMRIFGTGPFLDHLKERAKDNVVFLGRVSDTEKAQLYANSIAYIHPQEEDFGITAVEAMACGRPVIAFGKGGALESVHHGVTGIHFTEQSWESLADAMLRLSDRSFDPLVIREHAQQFSRKRFEIGMRELVQSHV